MPTNGFSFAILPHCFLPLTSTLGPPFHVFQITKGSFLPPLTSFSRSFLVLPTSPAILQASAAFSAVRVLAVFLGPLHVLSQGHDAISAYKACKVSGAILRSAIYLAA